ncbi:MAG: 2-hydroxyacyl-CoA dehydratase family protein [Acetobacteraceae bacterium]|nr:2-hydroxyacyl-CoA dehydratase family protein [Acetobacteraceae bacterium]
MDGLAGRETGGVSGPPAGAAGTGGQGLAEAWARARDGLGLDPGLPWAAWLCTYTPLELIIAAGLQPKRMLGTPARQGLADAYLTPNLCPYVRSVLAEALAGPRPAAAVIAASCNAMTHLASVWPSAVGSPAYLLDLPRSSDPSAVRYFAACLEGLAAWLEQRGQEEITPARLEAASEELEAARRTLAAAHRLAVGRAPALDGATLLDLARTAAVTPPARFRGAAEAVLAGATGPGGVAAEAGPEGSPPHSADAAPRRLPKAGRTGPRVLLTGSLVDPALVRILEEAGARVVADDLCLGSRSYLGLQADVAGGLSRDWPRTREGWFSALAQRYLAERPPCPRVAGFERRSRHLDALLRAARADGVVAYGLKFCDNSLYDFPAIRAHLARAGVPALLITGDYGGAGQGHGRPRGGGLLVAR